MNVCSPEPESIVSESAVTLCTLPSTACEPESSTRTSAGPVAEARLFHSAVPRGRAELCENPFAQSASKHATNLNFNDICTIH